MFRLKVRLHGADVKEIALESGREYTFGRGSDCDLQLEDQPGISRTHFKVFEEDGSWSAQVVSKFGDINVAGNPVQSVKLEVGTVFKLSGYDFCFFEQQSAVVTPIIEQESEEVVGLSQPIAVGQSQVMTSNVPVPSYSPAAFEGSDEATRVMEMQAWGDPYVRIVESSGREETIKLEGRKWIAGREEGSQILLNDRKASRRQFELVCSPQGNFVRDLGSSNGTQLNGMSLAPDELKPLKSGDVVQVGQLQVFFEVRDPSFERRLQVVPPAIMQQQLPAVQSVQYEMINYPVVQGPGGAVRVGPGGAPAIYEAPDWDAQSNNAKDAKAKKFRFYLIVGIIGALAYFFFADGGTNTPKKADPKIVQTPQQQAFAKLPPQKQQFVKEAFILGKNLYIQGKGAMASVQFAKIHEILKDGYEDSLAMAETCAAQAEQERNRQAIEDEMKQAAQNKVIILQNLEKCKPVAARSYSVDELMSCLQPTINIDPVNPAIGDYKGQIAARVAERDAKQARNRAYAASIAAGEALYREAQAIEKRGDGDATVDAYRKHYTSSYPDPKKLKEISRRKAGIIESNKAASIKSYLAAAEQAFVNKDYKSAISSINKVKGLDPYSSEAAELNGRINREKDQILRGIYEESILNEGLGQIDQAKANWKKIMDTDHPDGLYYKRARNKLKAIGGL